PSLPRSLARFRLAVVLRETWTSFRPSKGHGRVRFHSVSDPLSIGVVQGSAPESLISCPKQSEVTAEQEKATMIQVNNAMSDSLSRIRAHVWLRVTCLQRRSVTPRCALYERANVLSKRAGDGRTGHPIGDCRWPPDRGSPGCPRTARPGSRRVVPGCRRGSAGPRQTGQSDPDRAVCRHPHGGRATPAGPIDPDARGRALRAAWSGCLPAHVARQPGRRAASDDPRRRSRRGPNSDRSRHRTRYGELAIPSTRSDVRELSARRRVPAGGEPAFDPSCVSGPAIVRGRF